MGDNNLSVTEQAVAFLEEIKEQLNTQDNCATANPIFMVEELERVYGLKSEYSDKYELVEEEECQVVNIDDIEDEYVSVRKVYYEEFWKPIKACFSRADAEKFIELDGHNHKKLRIYVSSMHRCPQMVQLRNYLKEGIFLDVVQRIDTHIDRPIKEREVSSQYFLQDNECLEFVKVSGEEVCSYKDVHPLLIELQTLRKQVQECEKTQAEGSVDGWLQVGDIEVAPAHLWRKLPWGEGIDYCAFLGGFMPDRDQLAVILEDKAVCGAIDGRCLMHEWFWSSSEFERNYAWRQRQSDGWQGSDGKGYDYLVIPCRHITDGGDNE